MTAEWPPPAGDSAKAKGTDDCCLRGVFCVFTGSGEPPRLSERQRSVLWVVSVAGFCAYYDWELFPLTLKQLQESFDVSEARIGELAAVINLGRMGVLLLSLAADLLGRRVVLLAAILLYTLAILISAFQPTVAGFALFQFLSRVFLAGESNLANVYIVEEMAEHRGRVQGIVQSISCLGGGLSLVLFGFVGGRENGWRMMYCLGFLQLVLLYPMWRSLPESSRFRHGADQQLEGDDWPLTAAPEGLGPPKARPYGMLTSEEDRGLAGSEDALSQHGSGTSSTSSSSASSEPDGRPGLRCVEPLRLLLTSYPGRAFACVCSGFLGGFSFAPADTFKIKFLQDQHGLSPALVSLCTIGSGLVNLLAFPHIGRLGDAHGRRLLVTIFYALCPLANIFFYNAPGALFLPAYFAQMASGMPLLVLSGTFFAESFPVSHRSTAYSAMVVANVLGGLLGLTCESLLYQALGSPSHAGAISLLLLCGFPTPLIVHRCMPETLGYDIDMVATE